MKKTIFLFPLVFLAIFFLPISHLKALDTSLKIYDDADILTEEEENALRDEVQNYIDIYDMDMVLVTTKTNPQDTYNYAADFYDENGFGIHEHKDGVLFLIDRTQGYNDVYMLTTGEAIRVYDDARIDSIIDDVAEVKTKGYYQMFHAFITSSFYYASLGVAPSNAHTHLTADGSLAYDREFPWFRFLLFSSIIATIIVAILVAKNKMVKKAFDANGYLEKGSVNFTRKQDQFLHTHTSSIYIGSSSSSSSGGRVGGSTTHSSHSGTSHGGGGRRL